MRERHLLIAACLCWVGICGFPAPDYVPEQTKETTSLGPEWAYAAGSNESQYFFNLRTIRLSGPFVRVWGLDNRPSSFRGKPFQSSKWLDEYDCEREQKRTLSVTGYSEQNGYGSVIGTDDLEGGGWVHLNPGSVGEALWKFACRIHELDSTGLDKLTKVTGNDKQVLYAGQRKQYGTIVKMIVLNDYIHPMTYKDGTVSRSDRQIREFDCSSRLTKFTSRYIDYSDEMGRGAMLKVGSFHTSDDSEWKPVKNGTLGEDVLNFACKNP